MSNFTFVADKVSKISVTKLVQISNDHLPPGGKKAYGSLVIYQRYAFLPPSGRHMVGASLKVMVPRH